MANRIDEKFAQLRPRGERAFIAYIAAGDPTLDATKALALALEAAGTDILELGLPFSDPLADGIVNQLAAQRALAAGATTRRVLETVRAIRAESQIPIVLYMYLNPLFAFGFEEFHRAAAEAGVDGLLILDLPPDEDGAETSGSRGDLKRIRLIAPTTPPERIGRIAAAAEGFIYYVSREGVTGERATVSETIGTHVAEIRRHTDLPIAVGFGISTPEQARQVAAAADGVVVGSAIVKRIAEYGNDPDLAGRIGEFVKPLAAATKGLRQTTDR
jgi:tryptophan synthase alpha chain